MKNYLKQRITIIISALFGVLLLSVGSASGEQRRSTSEKSGHFDSIYGAWDPRAFDEFLIARECLEGGGRNCPRDPCASIREKLSWLGYYCQALVADSVKRQKRKNLALNVALSEFAREIPEELLAADRVYANASGKAGGDRYDRIEVLLEVHIGNYTSWRRKSLMTTHFEPRRVASSESEKLTSTPPQEDDGLVDMEAGRGEPMLVVDVDGLRASAEAGRVDAQVALGDMYGAGLQVPKDDAQAVHWYRKAAERGDAVAQYKVAVAFSTGAGVKKDDDLAVAWLLKSAEQGYPEAQNDVGVMYADGSGGFPEDDGKALILYKKAAESGSANAQFNLATMYFNGRGVEADPKMAAAWYQKAANQDHPGALSNLGYLHLAGVGVLKSEQMALLYFERAARKGSADGMHNLALLYETGGVLPQNHEHAVGWYRQAAEQGFAESQYNLGLKYANGEGVAVNEEEAAFWYLQAAEQGYAPAQNNIGLMLKNGHAGLEPDQVKAVFWFQKAALQGLPNAQSNLAIMYWEARGVDRALITAAVWMAIAAVGGQESAGKNLDLMKSVLSQSDLQKAQLLVSQWEVGELIPEVDALPVTTPARSTAGVASPSTTQSTRGNNSFPARPEKKPGVVSCNTKCFNGDCYRTYDDGRQVRIQATRRMNGFGEWEWDAGGC